MTRGRAEDEGNVDDDDGDTRKETDEDVNDDGGDSRNIIFSPSARC